MLLAWLCLHTLSMAVVLLSSGVCHTVRVWLWLLLLRWQRQSAERTSLCK